MVDVSLLAFDLVGRLCLRVAAEGCRVSARGEDVAAVGDLAAGGRAGEGIALITDPVAVGVCLIRVRVERAVVGAVIDAVAILIRVTGVTDPVAVLVCLVGVGDIRTVVVVVRDSVAVSVRIRSRRWRRSPRFYAAWAMAPIPFESPATGATCCGRFSRGSTERPTT